MEWTITPGINTGSPYLSSQDSDLEFFFMEVAQMSLSRINDGIDSCECVMNGSESQLSWYGDHVFRLKLTKDTCVLEYNWDFVAEFPTLEIYAMLKAYRDKLVEYQAESK